MSKQLFLFTLAILISILSACGQNASTAANIADLANRPQLSSLFDKYTAVAKSAPYLATITSMKALHYADFYQSLTQGLDNAEHEFGGYTFRDQLAMTVSLKADYQALDQDFGGIAGYWQKLGIQPSTAVTITEFNDGLAVMEKAQNAWEAKKPMQLSPEDSALVVKAQLVSIGVLQAEAGTATASLSLLSNWCFIVIGGNCGDNGHIHNSATISPNTNIGLVAGQANGNTTASNNHIGSDDKFGNGNGANSGNGNGANNGNGNGANNGNGNGANNGNGNGANSGNGNGANSGNGNGSNNGSGNGSNNGFGNSNRPADPGAHAGATGNPFGLL